MPTAISTIKTNKIYTKYCANYKGRYLALFGGAGSGKSVYAVQMFIKRLVNEKDANHKFMFVRKVARTIKDSIFEQTILILKEQGFYQFCKINKVEKEVTFEPNGNKIIMLGLDDPEKIKSISGVTGIFCEEITELNENDFLQLDLRLRGKHKTPLQFVYAFNPVDSAHWLTKYVEPQLKKRIPENIKNLEYLKAGKVWQFTKVTEDKNELTTRVINTTYKDNRFIDNDYKSQLKLLSSVSEVYHEVYERGRWGRVKTGDLFAHAFNPAKHLKENTERNEQNTLHFSVDFNVRPYMSGLIIELEYINGGFWAGFSNYWQLKVIDEIANTHPRNTAHELGAELISRYDVQSGFFLYGDASGNKSLGVKDTKTHFYDLKQGLGHIKNNCAERIPSQNPRFKSIAPNSLGRKAFLNLLFSGSLPCRIIIDSKKCTNFINDLKYCLQDGSGRLLKKKNKEGFEERGHHLDAFQYFICHPDTLGYLAKIKK
tara:strand:- start:98 stop:1555 length:1458 start_codon:yes stop_codon:yes gene_type:complete